MSLQDYQIDTAALLHDSNNLFTSLYMLTRYINKARDQVAQDTSCLRALIPGQSPFGAIAQPGTAVPGGAVPGQPPVCGFQTIAGQEKYPYQFGNQYLKQQYRGYRSVCDVFDVAVSWGGALRPVQNWMPWDELQAVARSYNIGVFSYPFFWSNTGASENGQIWLWPAPSTISEMEWDAICYPTPLYRNDDFDAIPTHYKEAVQYWAAYLAKQAQQKYGEAQEMRTNYYLQIGSGSSAAERARVPDYYTDVSMW